MRGLHFIGRASMHVRASRRSRRAAHLAVCLLACPCMARAQISTQVSGAAAADGYGTLTEPDVPEKAGKVLRAIRVVVAPSIDGALDEAMWALADSAAGRIAGSARSTPGSGSRRTH